MSRAIKQGEMLVPQVEVSLPARLLALWPVILPIAFAVLIDVWRLEAGRTKFLYEGTLTMLALICYVTASALMVTNLFVKEEVLYKLGLVTVAIGYCFNLSGWMMRWIEAGEKEGWKEGINGVWRYFPLDNLYALTLGFCAGAALATLVIIRKPQYRFLGAMSLPLLSAVLTLGIFLGNDIITLQPILDSYWRPIHVSIATVGYGVCLVSFGLAFAYLLKDGVRSEAIAIGALLFGLLVYGWVGGKFEVALHQEYGLTLLSGEQLLEREGIPLIRAMFPGVGWMMAILLAIILAALALFVIDHLNNDEKARRWGWRLFRTAVLVQAIVLLGIWLQFGRVNEMIKDPANHRAVFSDQAKLRFGKVLTEGQPGLTDAQMVVASDQWLQERASTLNIKVRSNPVELGSLVGVFVALLLVSLFAWKRDDVVGAMPSLQTIDTLLYRTVGVAFPLLTMLLITGAVWANESWGRYWGWDAKEVGALVAWMAYAGFLHTRVAHGWRGRRSAYFALLGFALVIFTWLGVSFLIKGLHSYA
jgi:ABC-type transport system involved in cytochrome c biogenesis permease subunit